MFFSDKQLLLNGGRHRPDLLSSSWLKHFSISFFVEKAGSYALRHQFVIFCATYQPHRILYQDQQT